MASGPETLITSHHKWENLLVIIVPEMAPAKTGGLSEYELQRVKNLEENRRILESIRQEQVISFD